MKKLNQKRILLGITGGVGAYKSADLVRRLREIGAEVRVVMTPSAQQFMTPLTFQALSGYPVLTDDTQYQSDFGMDHIALARWADVILIAPTTADFMAKLACGLADNILSTLCVASEVPIILAPAMNQAMWKNAATQANKQTLLQRGVIFFGPAEGAQACGEYGAGRMLEPADIITALENHLYGHCDETTIFVGDAAIQKKLNNHFQKIKFLITAGPTQEPIDPVRYLTNRSSGKMGYALAQVVAQQGANVVLISGPTALDCPVGVTHISVTSAEEMYQAVMEHVKQCDVFISTAAVSDYRVKKISPQKIKKTDECFELVLTRNADILSTVTQLKNAPFTVGFAAESENLKTNALKKLKQKKLDMIAANCVTKPGVGFDADQNELLVLWKGDEQILPKQPKIQLAENLLSLIAKKFFQTKRKTHIRNS